MNSEDHVNEEDLELQKNIAKIRVLLEVAGELFRNDTAETNSVLSASEAAAYLQGKAYDIAAESNIEDIFDAPLDIELVNTCRAVPEQYDVFMDNLKIGYLRLRHGRFSANFLSHLGKEVYSTTEIRGVGSFYDQEERVTEIRRALVAILNHLGCFNPKPKFEVPVFEDEYAEFSDSFEMLADFQKEVENREG